MVNVSECASVDAYRQLYKQPDSSRGILLESNEKLEEKVTICNYKETATHSSILAQEIPWTEEPGRLPAIGSQKSQIGLID